MINTLKHLAFELKVDLQELELIINNIDNFYYEKREPKTNKNGNPKFKNGIIQERVLNPSIARLKIIQKRIHRIFLSKLPMPNYVFGAIKGRDNILNAKQHQGNKYIFNTDLKKFFPSINHKQVFEMYRSFDFSPTVSRYLTKLTTYKGKLPQGAPTSPLIANLVFIRTGKELQKFAKENGLVFTSFIDDLTFSAPKDFKSKAHLIIEKVINDGFKISHDKTNYKTRLPVVTGIVVKNNNIDLQDSFKIKLRETIEKSPEQIKGLQLYANRVKTCKKLKKKNNASC